MVASDLILIVPNVEVVDDNGFVRAWVVEVGTHPIDLRDIEDDAIDFVDVPGSDDEASWNRGLRDAAELSGWIVETISTDGPTVKAAICTKQIADRPAADNRLVYLALLDAQFHHFDLGRWQLPHPAQKIAPWIVQRFGATVQPGRTAESVAAEILGVCADSEIFGLRTVGNALEEAVARQFGPAPWGLLDYTETDRHNNYDILDCAPCGAIAATYGSEPGRRNQPRHGQQEGVRQ